MATATQTLPEIKNKSDMISYANIVNQKQPVVTKNNTEIPIELDDHRMKNKLFLIHPDLIEKIEYTYKPPPPPPGRFKFQCVQDFIDWNIKKYNDDFDDEHYNDIYNEDRLYETPRFNNDDDYDYYSDYDYEEELPENIDQ